MRDIPIDVLLSFPIPNYVDPVTRGKELLGINIALIIVVFIVVSLRLYTRIVIKKWFGSDDFWIIPALIATVGLCTVVILANAKYGWDRHVYDIRFALIPKSLKMAFIAKLLFTFAATFIRCSLLCFYYRLSRDSAIIWFRWAIHITMGFNAAICISFVFLGVFLCTPPSEYWTFPTRTEACLDDGRATLAAGIINCIADLLVTILPIPVIASLQMPLRQRISVIVLLSTGFVVTIAGVIRTYYIWKSLMTSYDETWDTYPLWIAAAVEIDLGVICACAPGLKPLLNRPFQALSAALSSSKNNIKSAVKGSSSSGSFFKKSRQTETLDDHPDSLHGHCWPNNIKLTTTFELSEGESLRKPENAHQANGKTLEANRVYPNNAFSRDSREILLRPNQAAKGFATEVRPKVPPKDATTVPVAGYGVIP